MSHLEDEELDALLAKELTHDPGEAYFASFADRVAARIEADALAAAPAAPIAPPVKRGGLAAWFGSLWTPRGLAYAGGTLALLVVAGLAYRNAQHGAVAPTAVLQSDERVIPSEPSAGTSLSADATESQAAKESPNESSPSDQPTPVPAAAKASGSTRETPTARMYEVRPGANGEDVPVKPRVSSPRPALAPIPGESEQTRAKRELNAQPMRTQALGETSTKSGETAQPSNAPAPSIAAERRGGMQPARDEDAGAVATKELSVTNRLDSTGQMCGAVRDASGRPVAGARVTLTSDGSGATTDNRGAFCLPRPQQSGTLSVLAVGFRESRLTVGPSSSQALAVTLNAVDPLAKVPVRELERYPGGPTADSDLGFRGTRTGPVTLQIDGKVRADAYARESAPARASVAFAREAQKAAEKTPTTEAWTVAGERWSLVASLVRTEAAVPDARFNAAKARYASWELGPDDRRKRHAREAVDAYLAIAANGPLRDLALGWRAKLGR